MWLAKGENEQLKNENHRIAQKVLVTLEKIQDGKVPRTDQIQAHLDKVLSTLSGALEDPSSVSPV